MYKPNEMAELRSRLTRIYVDLKMGGDAQKVKHLDVERIDFGVFETQDRSHPESLIVTMITLTITMLRLLTHLEYMVWS